MVKVTCATLYHPCTREQFLSEGCDCCNKDPHNVPAHPTSHLMLCWEREGGFAALRGGRASPHLAWVGNYCPCYGHWARLLLQSEKWCLVRQRALRMVLSALTQDWFLFVFRTGSFNGKSSKCSLKMFSSCPGPSTNALAKSQSAWLFFEGWKQSG